MFIRSSLAGGVMLLLSTFAHAQHVITVDSNLGTANVAGACTLRDAIQAINDLAPRGGCPAGDGYGDDTIVISISGQPAVITLTQADPGLFNGTAFPGAGLPPIGRTLTILGNYATIRRDPALACPLNGSAAASEFRLLHVLPSGDAFVRDITLLNGCADDAGSTGNGGAIRNEGYLELVSGLAELSEANYGGGAIQSSGTLVLIDFTLAHNSASAFGGGIFSSGTTNIFGSALVNNTAGSQGGGGIYVNAGYTQILNSTLALNSTTGPGGAIAYNILAGSGTLSLVHATVAHNNSTYFAPSGVYASNTGAGLLQIKNSLIAANGNVNCSFSGAPGTAVIGANLSSDNTCTGFSLSNTNPWLGSFAGNGGWTANYALLIASPAIDAVTDCTRVDGTPVSVDQRGFARPINATGKPAAHCDIGAFEEDPGFIFGDGFNVIY